MGASLVSQFGRVEVRDRGSEGSRVGRREGGRRGGKERGMLRLGPAMTNRAYKLQTCQLLTNAKRLRVRSHACVYSSGLFVSAE